MFASHRWRTLAGAAGVEPAVPVFETGGLPLTDAPVEYDFTDFKKRLHRFICVIGTSKSVKSSFCFFVRRMSTAPLAVPAKLQPLRHVLLVLACVVVSPLALGTRHRRLFLRHSLFRTKNLQLCRRLLHNLGDDPGP